MASSVGGSQSNGSARAKQFGGDRRESIQSPSRVLSPALSDADSATSSTATGRRDSLNTSRKLGNLQGAGLSSLSLALGADHGYTAGSSLVGFNAISTLLNNPNKVSRPIDPSSSRYPPISQSHTDIPKVKRSDYESEESNEDAGEVSIVDESSSAIKGRQSVDDEDVSRRALGKKRLPPLSTVPQVFFSEDFDLGNPYTFDLVTERYKAASSSSSGNASRNGSVATGYDVALNQMLQEKLSYYSDVVEQHLILEISARSSSFFAALGNLKDLEAESRSCLDKVEELRRELDDRDEGIAKAGLSLIREQAKRRETVERLEAVGLMNQLCEKRDLCQLLVQNNEWSEALDVMQDLQNVIQGKTKLLPRPKDGTQNNSAIAPHVEIEFENVVAVQALGPQLEEMQNNISSQLEVELLNILLTDLTDRVGKPGEDTAAKPSNIDPSVEDINNTTTSAAVLPGQAHLESNQVTPNGSLTLSSIKNLTQDEEALSKRIEAHIGGLVRTSGMDRLMVAYKDAILREARKIMRTFLCDAQLPGANGSTTDRLEWLGHLATLIEDDEAAQGKADAKLGHGGLEAAQKLQSMEHTQFLGLLRTLLRGLTAFVGGVDSQRRVLVHILDKEARSKDVGSSTGSNGEGQIEIIMPNGVSPSFPNALSNIITEACSATHILASRFLSLRSSTHTVLPLRQFLGVFHLAWTFILESESICGRMIVGLRGVVLNQAKAWLGNFHKVRIENAAKAVEEEQWGQADVLPRQQSEITLVVESATSDPPTFVVGKESIQKSDHAEKDESESKSGEPKSKSITIEEKQFFVVSASLDVLDMLVEYLQVIINLPLLSTEIMGRVVEFLKQFNSRTCQVVLGAGAMRSAGLKNITAKHLALASQSLSIMILLIPYIREAIIIQCRLAAPIEGDGAVGAVKPMMDLVKETTTLHKVLCKYLQPTVVEGVIGQVLVSIDKRIASEFRKIESHDENTTKRVKAVRDHFNDKFGTLKHVDWIVKDIDEAIEEVSKTPEPPATSSAKVSLDESSTASPNRTSIMPTSYTPRLSLFARKQQERQQQQQQQQQSPVVEKAEKELPLSPADQAASSTSVAVEEEVRKSTDTKNSVELGKSEDAEITVSSPQPKLSLFARKKLERERKQQLEKEQQEKEKLKEQEEKEEEKMEEQEEEEEKREEKEEENEKHEEKEEENEKLGEESEKVEQKAEQSLNAEVDEDKRDNVSEIKQVSQEDKVEDSKKDEEPKEAQTTEQEIVDQTLVSEKDKDLDVIAEQKEDTHEPEEKSDKSEGKKEKDALSLENEPEIKQSSEKAEELPTEVERSDDKTSIEMN
ncbi:hypothetical protein L7F22_019713 [Adiantum nelumboides]|nr:hypothetical protein [Adiantum nelumboides]